MRERPILFSAPMVCAIIAGAKNVTRRLVKLPRWAVPGTLEQFDVDLDGASAERRSDGEYAPIPCPYGVPGDRLWVRETWRKDSSHDPDDTLFRADVSEEWERANAGIVTWKPGIHLPRARARITLDVVNVRVERLHAIDDSDAIREGIPAAGDVRPFARFAELWDAINGARSPWTSNPWVWRVEFRVAEVRRG